MRLWSRKRPLELERSLTLTGFHTSCCQSPARKYGSKRKKKEPLPVQDQILVAVIFPYKVLTCPKAECTTFAVSFSRKVFSESTSCQKGQRTKERLYIGSAVQNIPRRPRTSRQYIRDNTFTWFSHSSSLLLLLFVSIVGSGHHLRAISNFWASDRAFRRSHEEDLLDFQWYITLNLLVATYVLRSHPFSELGEILSFSCVPWSQFNALVPFLSRCLDPLRWKILFRMAFVEIRHFLHSCSSKALIYCDHSHLLFYICDAKRGNPRK